MNLPNDVGFIGLGLIGGSIAKALKKAKPDINIYAFTKNHSDLSKALEDKTIDVMLDAVDERLSSCDIIFLCAPTLYNEDYLLKLKNIISSKTIITDVGSTKTSIHNAVIKLGLEECFIGGHPMAGSELSGYEHSDSLLLENAYYMITPTAKSSVENISRLEAVALAIKAIPYVIDYKKHDIVTATISHVPHLIAAALVNLVASSDDETKAMKKLAAGGFKDITRIASSSPIMWEQICSANKNAIIEVLEKYISSLDDIKDILKSDNSSAIATLFSDAGSFRKTINDESKGLINAKYSFSVHVADRPGSISIISAILAARGISIKNIGINHNREMGEGALLISFYDADSAEYAMNELSNYDYKISKL